jgi:nucleoside-diphosphate-sugar epimerase
VWGSGRPRREFLHVDDLADACVFVMGLPQAAWAAATHPMLSHVNVGTGSDVTIAELAALVADVTGFRGRIEFDVAYPDGTARKLLDVSLLARLGWRAKIALADGVRSTYEWYCRSAGADAAAGALSRG